MKKFLLFLLAFLASTVVIACGLDETTTTSTTTASTTSTSGTTTGSTTTSGTTTSGTGTTTTTTSGTTTTTTTTTTPTTTTTTTEYTTESTTPATTVHTVDYESNVNLNVAINYNGNQFITYQLATAYTSAITGQTYSQGDLLPVWEAIGDKLHITFVESAVSSDTSTNNQWVRQQGLGFAGLDLINGTGANIAAEAVQNGTFVDIAQYLTSMPNLNAFLEANPSVRYSMTAADGGIYYTPYFDGFGEMEQMYLMRIDWVEDILDVASPTFDTTAAFIPTAYTRQQMPNSLTADIVVANADGTTRIVEKSYTSNILNIIKGLGSPTGATLATAFRTYMTNTYGDQGYAKLSDVFCGTDAAYDTDELIALMYVIKSNPLYLTREHAVPLTSVSVYVPREGTAARINNLVRGMEMYGLRGVFSKCEYLYFDQAGVIQDIRHDQDFVDAIGDLVSMSTDGLIPANLTATANWRDTVLRQGKAFMMYDYNATQTATSVISAGVAVDPTFKFQAVLPPVVDWLGNGTYFHFTESVRSVKAEAWGIVADAERSETELYRILKLVDELYDYSAADSVGTMHLYGPVGYTDGTIAYGSDVVYKMSDEALAEMASISSGLAMIDYLRKYVGGTLPIGHIRSLGLEYQTLSPNGKAGVERLNTAVAAGVLLLAGNVKADNAVGVDETNPWFQLSPTTFPLTAQELADIASFATFRTYTNQNAMTTLVPYGFSGTNGALTEAAYWALWDASGINVYTEIYILAYRDAYSRLLQFMAEGDE